jgi:hypothetical protein
MVGSVNITRTDFDMQNLNHAHSRAIYTEIGERMRISLSRNQLELPASMEAQLNWLRELDEESPSLVA